MLAGGPEQFSFLGQRREQYKKEMWVKLVANMVKTYPTTFNLNLDLDSSPIAQNVVEQLTDKGELTSFFL